MQVHEELMVGADITKCFFDVFLSICEAGALSISER
jgi:hypothetical protein